jgi:hypothetical protein
MEVFWTVSGQRQKALQGRQWQTDLKKHSPFQLRRKQMNRQRQNAFTHYSEVTDAKQLDVRKMQVAVALSILRKFGQIFSKVFNRSSHGTGEQLVDRV